jgi:hypothetical protein
VSVVWKEVTVVFVRDRGFLQDIFDISGRTNEIITPARSRILGKFASVYRSQDGTSHRAGKAPKSRHRRRDVAEKQRLAVLLDCDDEELRANVMEIAALVDSAMA